MKRFSQNLEISYVQIDLLIPNPNNARTHSEKQVTKIARSIKKLGFNNPVLVNQNKMIIAGHGRVMAAKELGIVEVPVIFLEHLSPEQIRAYIVADNKLAEEAGWDNEILKIELKELADIDIDFATITGFDIPEIDLVINNNETEKRKVEKPDKADILPDDSKVTKRVNAGDLWKLGENYLYCGNSLIEESFRILLGDRKADIVFCDPPYNVPIDGHVCGSGNVKHNEFVMASGEMTSSQFTEFLEASFKNLAKYSVDGSIHYLCMDWRHILEIMTAGNKVYSELKNICVWNKQQGGMGSLYRSQHELVFVFKNGAASHINNIELGKHGRYRTNVWSYKGVSATNPKSLEDLKLHPTVKPVSMIVDAILDCSRPGDVVLDCFAGSGSTLIAAERSNRRAYCIEFEPHYCDVILCRYEKLFKKKVVLVDNIGGKIDE